LFKDTIPHQEESAKHERNMKAFQENPSAFGLLGNGQPCQTWPEASRAQGALPLISAAPQYQVPPNSGPKNEINMNRSDTKPGCLGATEFHFTEQGLDSFEITLCCLFGRSGHG
jgi:hypothetical protein